MDFTVRDSGADPFGKFCENMRLGIVCNRVHGVEAESVKVKFF